MYDRSQSDVVGTVLLISVVILTVTASGAVVLSEWESDVGDKPVADIESELTAVNISVEHRGGQPLDPNQTSVEIIGSDENASLNETLEPGESTEWEFERLEGSIELVIVDEPTETVLHRNTHTIVNPIEGIWFGVDGWTEPIYLLEGHPANYTVAQEFELGAPHLVTDRANVTVEDDSIVKVDSEEETLTGVKTGETDATANTSDFITDTAVVVLESDPELAVANAATETLGLVSAEAQGELVDLGGLPSVDLYFEYWPSRAFTEAPASQNDSVIADGEFHTDPDGYAHDNDYVHDNEPLVAGKTRVFTYDEAGSGASYRPHLRDEKKEAPNGGSGSSFYTGDRELIPNNEQFRTEVTLSDDGETVDIVIFDNPDPGDGEVIAEQKDIDVSDHPEVYFSVYEWSGSSGETSLRLIGIDDVDESERVQAAIDADTENRLYASELSGFDLERGYALVMQAEQEVGGKMVTDQTDPVAFQTTGPTVETIGVDIQDIATAEAEGKLVDLGDAAETDLYFEYWPSRVFTEAPASQNDSVIADGGFHTDPDGYAHDNDYVHDNEPLVAGKTRVFTYDEAGSGASYRPHLRDETKEEPNGGSGSSFYTGDRETIPNNEQFRTEVTLSDDGETVDIVIFDNPDPGDGEVIAEQTDVDVSDHSEVYFSVYEWSGLSGETSLRLIGIDDIDELERVDGPTDVDSEQTYTEIIQVDHDYGYVLRAGSETDNEDLETPVTDDGELIEFEME